MIPYRIKHKPTGLYYLPYRGYELSTRGKVYTSNRSILSFRQDYIWVSLYLSSVAYKGHKNLFDKYTQRKLSDRIMFKIPKSEFIKEEIKL